MTLPGRGPILDTEIIEFASRYGLVANIEVTNGCCGDKKVNQSRGARTFLGNQIRHTSASQLTGIFSIRDHGYDLPISKDLSFIVNSREYDPAFLREIADELLYYSEPVHQIPKEYSFIFISKVLDEGMLTIFNHLLDISGRLSVGLDYMLMKDEGRLEAINSALDERDQFRNIDSYFSYISCFKGTLLEVYAAKLFKKHISDSVVFVRKDYTYSRPIQENALKTQKFFSDIDVGVICRKEDFLNSLKTLSELGYNVRHNLAYGKLH